MKCAGWWPTQQAADQTDRRKRTMYPARGGADGASGKGAAFVHWGMLRTRSSWLGH